MGFLSRLFRKSGSENKGDATVADHVTFDDAGVRRTMANGKIESIGWGELQEVYIVTTDQGPYADDAFWVLDGGEKNGCAIPSEAAGMIELLTRLQALPGFDNQAVIQAMSSSGNERFLCWKRSARP